MQHAIGDYRFGVDVMAPMHDAAGGTKEAPRDGYEDAEDGIGTDHDDFMACARQEKGSKGPTPEHEEHIDDASFVARLFQVGSIDAMDGDVAP